MRLNGIFTVALSASLAVGATGSALALEFDQDVTNNAIFGSGNTNGGYTVDRNNGIELGLRGKLRFDSTNTPQNQFNSQGNGDYNFSAGTPPTGFSFDPGSPTTPIWNFEWSINSNFDGNGGALNSATYLLELDSDPTAGVNFGTGFDPINVPVADHSIGDNTTGEGEGVETNDPTTYQDRIANNNLAQNSWSYEFFNEATDNAFLAHLASFDPNAKGVYTIRLTALGASGETLAQSSININAVPVPAALPLMAGAAAVFGFVGWRRRKTAA